MSRFLLAAALAAAPVAAQPITPFSLFELRATHAELRGQPSSTDLVSGFSATTTNGILSDQVINESAHSGNFGFIDPNNGVVSFLMQSPSACSPLLPGFPSDGFHPCCGGNVAQLNNGALNGPIDGVLRDFARASLVVRYGFDAPTDIGAIRVIGGNTNNADGRTFHSYDVWASTDGLGQFGNYFPVASGVTTGPYGVINAGLWSAALTEVHDFDSKTLASGVTDLRLVFYCVSNTQAQFTDPWDGSSNDDPAYRAQCDPNGINTEPGDSDGLRKAFEAPVLREIDVFAPGAITPWADIDYDQDQDLADYAAYQNCVGGDLVSGGCYRFDLDENGTVANDLLGFTALMTGPN